MVLLFDSACLVKNLPVSAGDIGDMGSIPGSGGSSGEGNGNPLQYSCLGNPWTEKPGRLQSIGLQEESDMTENTHSVCSPGSQQ